MTLPSEPERRGAAILLHITSLPGPRGIGTLGRESRIFLDQLVRGGMSAWQVLPLGPTAPVFGHSPYAASSAFAGNPLLLDLESIQAEPWCPDLALGKEPSPENGRVDFPAAIRNNQRLDIALEGFSRDAPAAMRADFDSFCKHQSAWLDDFALFNLYSRQYETAHWPDWPESVRLRDPATLAQFRRVHARAMEAQDFRQFLFQRQWQRLRTEASRRGIQLIGDLPIYVALDGADAWSHPEVFDLDPRTRSPRVVAGVPPDYFSSTGQLWGNPLYRWFDGERLNPAVLNWWEQRFRRSLEWFDRIRLDHFRGFVAFWSVPAEASTAEKGEWVEGPGGAFFTEMQQRLGGAAMPLIAEDLGEITEDVNTLRERLGLPGMKILQFAFDGNPLNPHLPHNFTSPDWVVYTGTHDNNTLNGWYYGSELDESGRNRVREYVAAAENHDMHRHLVRLVMQSTARTAVIPMQDALGYGAECRMNTPGRSSGNWEWKLTSRDLKEETLDWLARLARTYGRA